MEEFCWNNKTDIQTLISSEEFSIFWLLCKNSNVMSYLFQDHAKSVANHYDAVVASEVIEHVNNQELFVKSCIHALKPGGRIFITTPNRTKMSQFFVIFLSENVFNLIPKGAHQYEKFITPNELTFILERSKYGDSFI